MALEPIFFFYGIRLKRSHFMICHTPKFLILLLFVFQVGYIKKKDSIDKRELREEGTKGVAKSCLFYI